MHLMDWATKHDEIEVFCKGHIPKTDVRVFTVIKCGPGLKRGYRVGVRALTENAKQHKNGNHPNCYNFEWEDL
jgi:hypothetical protein